VTRHPAARRYHRRVPTRIASPIVLALLAACGGKVSGAGGSSSGSSSGSGSGSSGGDNSCFAQGTGGSPACIACVESACASQLASAESACGDLIACECQGGVFDAAASVMCASQAEEPNCTSAVPPIRECEAQLCASSCDTSTGGSFSGGSSGGGSPPSECGPDPKIACSGGASGYVCAIGSDPEAMNPALSCSSAVRDPVGDADDFCCTSQ
jgi:hypothetical protein